MIPAVELLVGALLCSGVGCADPTEVSVAPPNVTVTSSGECVRVTFEITSSTTVTGTYPGASCPTVGLIVAKPANMTWVGGTRTLTIPMMVRNTSTLPIQLPLRLELPVDGKVVMLPAGTSNSKLVPLNMDSTLAADRKVWLIGSGTLSPGDSTAARNLTFRIDAPVTKGRFWFVSQGEEIAYSVPATAPDSIPSWTSHDSSYAGAGAKGILTLRFREGTPQSERQAAVDAVGGTVIGGGYFQPGEGVYLIRISHDGTMASVFAALPILRALPQVLRANAAGKLIQEGRRPNDGPGWLRNDWQFGYGRPAGETWALEDLRAPLAWGCEIGDSSVRLGVVDNSFGNPDLGGNLAGPVPIPLPVGLLGHGYAVASLIGARGNNDSAGTGMLWRVGLDLRQPLLGTTFAFETIAASVLGSGRAGARVINMSLNVPVDTPADTIAVADLRALLREALDTLANEGKLPLLVIPAGNVRLGWDLSPTLGLASLSQLYPNSVLVVGGTRRQTDSFLIDVVREASPGSRRGTLVDVYAPGEQVLLRLPTGQTGFFDGTSFSSALVAGIAGLLKSFDPSLTASELKQKIIAGAQAGGVSVSGAQAGGSRYLANAYESLKLAGQKAGMPICGFPVALRGQAPGQKLVLERSQTGSDTVVLPSSSQPLTTRGYRDPSVAQGGRLLAVGWYEQGQSGFVSGVDEYRLGSSGWTLLRTIANGWSRSYLEHDTADVASNFDTSIRLGSGGVRHVGPIAAIAPNEWLAFSPDGLWAIAGGQTFCSDGFDHKAYLINLQTATASPFHTSVTCAQSLLQPVYHARTVGGAWSPLGDRFVFAEQLFDPTLNPSLQQIGYRARRLVSGTVQVDGTDVLVMGRRTENAYIPTVGIGQIDASGNEMYWYEGVPPLTLGGTASCRLVKRSSFSPFSILSEGAVGSTANGDCASPVVNTLPMFSAGGQSP